MPIQSWPKRIRSQCILRYGRRLRRIVEELDAGVLQFTSKPGVKVKIAIEIAAESATGFDDNLQRAVKENCTVLRFTNAEFESQGD